MTGPPVLGLSVQAPLISQSLSVFVQVAARNGHCLAIRACFAAGELSCGEKPKNSMMLLAMSRFREDRRHCSVFFEMSAHLQGDRFCH
jgi:hypothetical protein